MNGVIEWFRDPEHWQGPYGVPTLLGQHVLLTLTAVGLAALVGFPLALWIRGPLRRLLENTIHESRLAEAGILRRDAM